MDIAIMLEGQNGLTWPRWKKIVRTVEENGFAGLYRSDHFTNAKLPNKDSLELWTSLTWLASHTERIEFGPLVTPVSFRHPAMTARFAASVDDLSGGRLQLGIGAGWQEHEHEAFGFELLDTSERFQRFEEGIHVIISLLRSDEPTTLDGAYYRLKDAILLPRPQFNGGPPIVIGGNGPKRTLPLVAKYADEWNSIYLPADKFQDLNGQLDSLIIKSGRAPAEVRRTMMLGCEFDLAEKDLKQKVKNRTGGKLSPTELHQRGLIVGTPDMVIPQIQAYAAAGIQRLMLQWLDLDNTQGLIDFSQHVLPDIS